MTQNLTNIVTDSYNVHKVLNQLNKEEISFSKMVEIFNEIASDFYKKTN